MCTKYLTQHLVGDPQMAKYFNFQAGSYLSSLEPLKWIYLNTYLHLLT